MINAILCSYNNYYNRIIKKLDTAGDYRTATYPNFIELENINFNPADGINTTLVVGKGSGRFLNWEQEGPNYCIIYKKEDDVETILSRWFIMDENRTRSGQYNITLRRDVLVDNDISESPIYVEKGIINDITSPLLCNNEGLTVNQIKKQEILLKDKTQCPWLVMYLKKGVLGSSSVGTDGKVPIDVPQEDSFVYETLNTPITQWGLYQYTSTDYKVASNIAFTTYWSYDGALWDDDYSYKLTKTGTSVSHVIGTEYTTNLRAVERPDLVRDEIDPYFKPKYNSFVSKLNSDVGFNSYDNLFRYDNKIIKDSDGKYFLVSIKETGGELQHRWVTSSTTPTLKSDMQDTWNQATHSAITANDRAFRYTTTVVSYQIVLTEQTGVEASVDFSEYTGAGTEDANYDIICMPYGEVYFSNPGELLHGVTSDKDRSLTIMNSIATQLTSQNVIDLQLLPYCPCQELIFDSNTPMITPLTIHKEGIVAYKPGTSLITDVILVPKKANISFDIDEDISIDVEDDVTDVFKRKYINDCTLFRLCSPNYNGLFEFNIAKNGGSIDKFNVDLTLKPINPYIHVNPNFDFLYGYDFNDIRGLVCGGDFSLGMIDEAWNVYEIQNKNYQAIFDRQIQNLDVNNSIARQEALWQLGAGTLQGTMTGATAGFMASGSPWGAIAGAAVGGVTSGVGGALDYANLEKRQRETKDFAIDNFNLQLGNVKALPNSITKTSALTANNKFFPFVEIYECTDEERQAYFNKLKYDGMTIGIIDKLSNYQIEGNEQFFKGQLIRNQSLNIDNHMMNEINNELMKGVYI